MLIAIGQKGVIYAYLQSISIVKGYNGNEVRYKIFEGWKSPNGGNEWGKMNGGLGRARDESCSRYLKKGAQPLEIESLTRQRVKVSWIRETIRKVKDQLLKDPFKIRQVLIGWWLWPQHFQSRFQHFHVGICVNSTIPPCPLKKLNLLLAKVDS